MILKSLAALVVAAALIATGAYLAGGAQTVTKIEIVREPVIAPPSAKAADSEMAIANPFGKPIAVAPAKSLALELRETKDIKSYVVEALKHPEQGGAYHARLALKRCADIEQTTTLGREAIARIVAAETTIAPERQAAIEAVAKRCGGFSAGEVETYEAQALRIGKSGADPLYKTLHEWTFAKGSEKRAAFERLVTSGSQELVSDADAVFLLIGGSDYFNGHTYSTPEEGRALLAATAMAACTPTSWCKLDWRMEGACGTAGECYATREDFVRQSLLKGDRTAFELAERLAGEMRDAIARKDLSAFSAPKGKP